MSRLRVGFLGLGTMGAPMAANLLKAGFKVQVWNRTPTKAQPFAAMGARIGKSPAHVAAESEIIITMVSQAPGRGSGRARTRAGWPRASRRAPCWWT